MHQRDQLSFDYICQCPKYTPRKCVANLHTRPKNYDYSGYSLNLLASLKDDLLYLHLVEEIIAFDGLRERHDLFKHEAKQVLLLLELLKCLCKD
jgi:hypothetical protein